MRENQPPEYTPNGRKCETKPEIHSRSRKENLLGGEPETQRRRTEVRLDRSKRENAARRTGGAWRTERSSRHLNSDLQQGLRIKQMPEQSSSSKILRCRLQIRNKSKQSEIQTGIAINYDSYNHRGHCTPSLFYDWNEK
jgi:hypothetical protein